MVNDLKSRRALQLAGLCMDCGSRNHVTCYRSEPAVPVELPPDMSDFKMTTIREGAPVLMSRRQSQKEIKRETEEFERLKEWTRTAPATAPAPDISSYKMEPIREGAPVMEKTNPISPKFWAGLIGGSAGTIVSSMLIWLIGAIMIGDATSSGVDNAIAAVPTPLSAFIVWAVGIGGALAGVYLKSDPERLPTLGKEQRQRVGLPAGFDVRPKRAEQ